jgi:hypothetical protein
MSTTVVDEATLAKLDAAFEKLQAAQYRCGPQSGSTVFSANTFVTVDIHFFYVLFFIGLRHCSLFL